MLILACGTRSRALSRECAVKAMSRQKKEELADVGGITRKRR